MKNAGFKVHFLLIIAAALCGTFLLFPAPFAFGGQPEPGVFRALAAGDPAPDILVEPVGGGAGTVVSFGGGGNSKAPALVWFWFMSCENCVKDMKFMRGIQKKYKKDISLVAVNVDRKSVV